MKVHEVEEKITTRIAGLEQQETRLQEWLQCLRQVGEIAEKHGYDRRQSQAEEGSLMQAFEELVDQAEPDDAPERETSRLYRDEPQYEEEPQFDGDPGYEETHKEEESYYDGAGYGDDELAVDTLSDEEPLEEHIEEKEVEERYDSEPVVEEVYFEEEAFEVLDVEGDLVEETAQGESEEQSRKREEDEPHDKEMSASEQAGQDEHLDAAEESEEDEHKDAVEDEQMSAAEESDEDDAANPEVPDEANLDELRSQEYLFKPLVYMLQ